MDLDVGDSGMGMLAFVPVLQRCQISLTQRVSEKKGHVAQVLKS